MRTGRYRHHFIGLVGASSVISPSPSARHVYSSAQKFESRLLRDISNVERPQQASVVCDDLNFVTGTARVVLAGP